MPRNAKKDGRRKSVEQAMPLADFQRDMAIMKNGDRIAYMELAGENVSLYDTAQKKELAGSLAAFFASIKREFAILKYPVEPDVSGQLAFINAAISRERAALAASQSDSERTEHEAMLAILEERLLPKAREEATGGSRWELPTWVAVRYGSGEDPDSVRRSMSSMLNAARQAGLRARYLDEAGMRRMYSLYFKPSGGETSDSGVYYPAALPERGR